MICDWPSWKENTSCLGKAEYSSSNTTRPSVNYAKDGLDQSFPITGLGWSKNRYHLWMWALWGSQQPFSCVLGHFRHGDTQVEVTGLNLSSVSALHSLKKSMFWLSAFTTFTFLKKWKKVSWLKFTWSIFRIGRLWSTVNTCIYFTIISDQRSKIADSTSTEYCSTFPCLSECHSRDISSFLDSLTI